jgi:hypothetical protein
MKSRFFAVCFSLAALVLASNASAQAIGEFFVGGGWSLPLRASTTVPAEKIGEYKALAESLSKRLPEGTDLRESASGFRNLGDFVSAVHASDNLKIPFPDVKARMMNGGNLDMALAALRPDIDAGIEARKARAAARETLRLI